MLIICFVNSTQTRPKAPGNMSRHPQLPQISFVCCLSCLKGSMSYRKSLLRTLAEQCSDKEEKHELLRLSSRGGRSDYSSMVTPVSPTLLDLLLRYPSCLPSLATLLDALPALPPRLYSISSSPLEHPHKPHIALTVVKIGNPGANEGCRQYSGQANGAEQSNGVSKEAANGKGVSKRELLGRWGVASGLQLFHQT